jgi:ribosome-binding protein aMBF1 (putative translation factor)
MRALRKRCPTCSRWLDLDAFGIARNRADGRQGECRECRRERQRRDQGTRRRNRPPRSGYAQLTAYIPDDWRQAVRAAAAREGISQSMLVERAIKAELGRLVQVERRRRGRDAS